MRDQVAQLAASSSATTAADMGRFMLAHLQDGQLGGARILAPGTADRMQAAQFTPHPRLPGVGYGFFEEDHGGRRVVSHDGSLPGTAALMALVPELELGIFAVANLSADECIAGSYRSVRRPHDSFLKLMALSGGGEETVRALGGGAIQIGRSCYVEASPMLFELEDGQRRAAFLAQGPGEPPLMTFGATTYERISWYDSLALHQAVALLCLLVFVSADVGWPAAALVRRLRRRAHDRRPLERVTRRVVWAIAIAPLVFILGVVVGSPLGDAILITPRRPAAHPRHARRVRAARGGEPAPRACRAHGAGADRARPAARDGAGRGRRDGGALRSRGAVRTRDEIEAALDRLGWRVIDGPTRTASGWKATIQRGTASKVATGSTEIGVLEDLLRSVEETRP